MTNVRLFWLGVSAAAIAAGASIWIDTDAPVTPATPSTEKRDCGVLFVPDHVKEKLRPECE